MYKQRNPFDTVVVGLPATARVVGLPATARVMGLVAYEALRRLLHQVIYR